MLILYFKVIIITLIFSLTILFKLTVDDARKVKERLEDEFPGLPFIERKIIRNKLLKSKEIVPSCSLRRSSSILSATSSISSTVSEPSRKNSRRLSKTESEEVADNMLDLMFRPDHSTVPQIIIKRFISEPQEIPIQKCSTRRRKFGLSRGSFGLSFNSLNMIKEIET